MIKCSLLLGIALSILVIACTGELSPAVDQAAYKSQGDFLADRTTVTSGAPAMPLDEDDLKIDLALELERIAEIERAGAFFPGLALVESGIREKSGDFPGAAVAAYKELAWSYGYGNIEKKQVEETLKNALALLGEPGPGGIQRRFGASALMGCIAFAREEWALAEELLTGVLKPDDEPDSFIRWMLLVCAMERNEDAKSVEASAARSAYSAIRARYMFFPEYWYRGVKAFSFMETGVNGEGSISAAYAEQCINISPQGPFAEDSRKVLAAHAGLSTNGKPLYSGLRTKFEIENAIKSSVSANDPTALKDLYPLISLPENPYTLYAMGALKALSSAPEFRRFFNEEAAKSSGRLGERLAYIARG